MSEWKFFASNTVPAVSTFQFHQHRERAAHLEQPLHRPRLDLAADMVAVVAQIRDRPTSVSDLGCGDGGLLSLLKDRVDAAWGYDFAPANVAGWAERGVDAQFLDVFGADREKVVFGHITVVTEVLEHLAMPHQAVAWIGQNSPFIVASSPHDEGSWWHDECHAWAWDMDGYRALIEGGGYRVLRHEQAGRFQVILGMKA